MSMENVTNIKQEALSRLEACESLADLQELRVLYLGKKGPIQDLMKSMTDLPKEEMCIRDSLYPPYVILLL